MGKRKVTTNKGWFPKGQLPLHPYPKGHVPWTKGKKLPQKVKNKIIATRAKNKENYRSWKGGITFKKDYFKNYLMNQRSAVVLALGGECKTCGFNDPRALQIDHINGGGSKERKERPYKGAFHSHVLKSFLAGENKYQLLCANCNWIKRFENKESKGRIVKKDII